MITRLASVACAALAVSVVAPSIAAGAAVAPDTKSSTPEPPNPFLPPDVATRRSTLTDSGQASGIPNVGLDKTKLLDEFLDALRVMQEDYFEPWLGQWPRAIDWTAAVAGTHLAGALSSVSFGLSSKEGIREKENLITTYFSQLLSYYFGQDAFSIRNEAFDDMLWVVLGWMEAIEFINYHTTVYHHQAGSETSGPAASGQGFSGLRNQSWYGNLWIPAFAHRARIFWDIASQGWDNSLCGGGMNWNPRLEPYKNAITNQLFIAASASMYLYFPGDPNDSPFVNACDPRVEDPLQDTVGTHEPHAVKHLQAALAGYTWLTQSGMLNEQGLFVDGFHISGWKNVSNPNTRCDDRNDMVYTYNQGVLLTGQINLWKVSGDREFLHDGHRLVQSVIRATGYDLANDEPIDDLENLWPGQLPPWHGLGRAGILEEQCDVTGRCSQDSQTFKGIFFHHLTAFCAPLDILYAAAAGKNGKRDAAHDEQAKDYHRNACAAYIGWIRHNARAALATRDAQGKFGMWWTAGLLRISLANLPPQTLPSPDSGNHAVDYRTYGVPNNATWVAAPAHAGPPPMREPHDGDERDQVRLTSGRTKHAPAANDIRYRAGYSTMPHTGAGAEGVAAEDIWDPNNRGRGRTVETQGGGLAVLRSLWEIAQRTTDMNI